MIGTKPLLTHKSDEIEWANGAASIGKRRKIKVVNITIHIMIVSLCSSMKIILTIPREILLTSKHQGEDNSWNYEGEGEAVVVVAVGEFVIVK